MNRLSELFQSAPNARTVVAPETSGRVLLAIDTALGTSVAVSRGGQIFEHTSDDPMRHAEAIGGLLKGTLDRAGVNLTDIEGIVFGVGPGPFTGLRVGITSAQTFALARGVALYPIHSHEAVALAALEHGATPRVRVVQDARRRELFVTDYTALDWAGTPVRSDGPRIVPRAGYEAVSAEVWPERIPAARLVQLAARKLASGQQFEANGALYLRQPDVKMPAGIKRVVP